MKKVWPETNRWLRRRIQNPICWSYAHWSNTSNSSINSISRNRLKTIQLNTSTGPHSNSSLPFYDKWQMGHPCILSWHWAIKFIFHKTIPSIHLNKIFMANGPIYSTKQHFVLHKAGTGPHTISSLPKFSAIWGTQYQIFRHLGHTIHNSRRLGHTIP